VLFITWIPTSVFLINIYFLMYCYCTLYKLLIGLILKFGTLEMLLLLLLSLLMHITTCTVYAMIPDGYLNTTCPHCHNLQNYLFDTTKYFTSNTQLFFLPGQHHLHINLIIQNVHNISLIGSTTLTQTL